MFSIKCCKNIGVFNIFGTPGDCINSLIQKKWIPLRTSANKNHHREVGRVTLRLASEASLGSPAGMEVVKHMKAQCFSYNFV